MVRGRHDLAAGGERRVDEVEERLLVQHRRQPAGAVAAERTAPRVRVAIGEPGQRERPRVRHPPVRPDVDDDERVVGYEPVERHPVDHLPAGGARVVVAAGPDPRPGRSLRGSHPQHLLQPLTSGNLVGRQVDARRVACGHREVQVGVHEARHDAAGAEVDLLVTREPFPQLGQRPCGEHPVAGQGQRLDELRLPDRGHRADAGAADDGDRRRGARPVSPPLSHSPTTFV